MASVSRVAGKLSLKMLDPNSTGYTEELGYLAENPSTSNVPIISDSSASAVLEDVNDLLQGAAGLMDGTVTNKLVTYTMEVSN